MGKRSKKQKRKSGRQKQVEPGGADASRLQETLRGAVKDGRGRRAVNLADRLIAAGGLGQPDGIDLIAAAAELRIRELFRDGHDEQGAALARRLASKAPEVAMRWPLGLCCRLGLAPELRSPYECEEIRTRLRCETFDPAELLACSCEATAHDARWVVEGWDRLDAGDIDAAESALRHVGRQSALIDWRLFLQAQIAIRRQLPAAYEANRGRVHPESPVRPMVESMALLNEPTGAASAPYTELLRGHVSRGGLEELAAMRAHDGEAQLRVLKRVFVRLRDDGHPSLASKLLTCFMFKVDLGEEYTTPIPVGSFSRNELTESFIRMFWGDPSASMETDEAISMMLSDLSSSLSEEKAFLLLLRCENARRISRSAGNFDSFSFLDDWDDSPIRPRQVTKWARKAAGLWPQLEEVYEVWDWAEREADDGGTQALAAWRKAFPERVDLRCRHIKARIERGDLAGVENDIAELAQIRGRSEEASELTNRHQLALARQAIVLEHFEEVDILAEAFQPRNAHDRVVMATCFWLAASHRGEKAKRGRILGDAGSPWLVAALALSLDHGLTYTRLPAGVKAALKAPPDQSVPQLLEAVAEVPDAVVHLLEHTSLFKLVVSMIESVREPALARDLLRYAVQDFRGEEDIRIDLGLLVFRLTNILLNQQAPHWVAGGLASRAGLISLLLSYLPDGGEVLTSEMRELFWAARKQFSNPTEARDLLEPYLVRTSVRWAELTEEDEPFPEPQVIVDRERSLQCPHTWREALLARARGQDMPHHSRISEPSFEDDEYAEEYEGFEDEEERSPLTDIQLPAYPPTTCLEAEVLFDQVLDIEDPAVRGRRLDELLELVDGSPVKGRAMENLRNQIADAKADVP